LSPERFGRAAGGPVAKRPHPAYLHIVRDFACSCTLPARGASQDNAEFGRTAARWSRGNRRRTAFSKEAIHGSRYREVFQCPEGFRIHQPTDGAKDVFVHISAVERAGMSSLHEGQKLSYDVVSERGKLAAANLQNI